MTVEEKAKVEKAIQEGIEKFPVDEEVFSYEGNKGGFTDSSTKKMSAEDIKSFSELFGKAKEFGLEDQMEVLINISKSQSHETGKEVIG